MKKTYLPQKKLQKLNISSLKKKGKDKILFQKMQRNHDKKNLILKTSMLYNYIEAHRSLFLMIHGRLMTD